MISDQVIKCFSDICSGTLKERSIVRSQERFQSSTAIFIDILKSCARKKDLYSGRKVHEDINDKSLLGKNVYLGSMLVNMYAKCGVLEDAQEVFDILPVRSVVAWSALIAGYAQHVDDDSPFYYFQRMKCECVFPNAITYLCILKACSRIVANNKGKEIHAIIVIEGCSEKNSLVGTALVDMYSKCGALDEAKYMFDKIPNQDVVSWNALIAGYAQHGYGKAALQSFDKMLDKGVSPDEVTLVCVLKACAYISDFENGTKIHKKFIGQDLLSRNIFVQNALLDMYAKCGAVLKAQEVFNVIPFPDVVSCNSLMGAYIKHGDGRKALQIYDWMHHRGISPDPVTFVFTLKACGSSGALSRGEDIHDVIVQHGLMDRNSVIGNAVVDMYAKCGALGKAQKVFDKLSTRNVISWSVLIAGYTENGYGKEAVSLFYEMQDEDISPDSMMLVNILKICGNIGLIEEGQTLHVEIKRGHFMGNDILVSNALIEMYVKCGSIAKANEVFSALMNKDVFSWNILIAGYVGHNNETEALIHFERMHNEGKFADQLTYVSVFKVCGNEGIIDKGRKRHAEVFIDGLPEENIILATALIEMYAKCGFPEKARILFDKIPIQDAVSWNVLIAGFAQVGKDDVVFELFEKMGKDGVQPDLVTFTIVLNWCSNSGLLDHGYIYFEYVSQFYTNPTLEHYTCIIDMLSRAGCFGTALLVIKGMPFSASLTIWHALLGACQNYGNIWLGKYAFKHVMQYNNRDASAYVSISNIYASSTFLDRDYCAPVPYSGVFTGYASSLCCHI